VHLVCPDCGAAFATAGERCPYCDAHLEPGASVRVSTDLGRAELGERLGRGSHTEVWAAEIAGVGPVAFKRSRLGDQEGAARIGREARLLGRCQHPGLVKLLGTAGPPDAPTGLFLPRYQRDLAKLARESLLNLDLRALASRVAGALSCLHGAGILHRDVRAANVLVGASGDPREVAHGDYVLADLGHASGPGVAPLTPEGHVVGTHGSIAPECVAGAAAWPASDVYALGVMLFSLIAGERPFAHPELEVELERAASEDAFPLSSYRHALPVAPELGALVEAAVHREPGRRPGLDAFVRAGAQRAAGP